MRVSNWPPTERGFLFWHSFGPFFASMVVRKEMPYLRDAPGYFWCAAGTEQYGAPFGIGSAHIDPPKDGKRIGFLHGLYVLPEHRRKGAALALVKRRMEWLVSQGADILRATATPAGSLVLAKVGFVAVGARGSFLKMEVPHG